LNSPFELPSLEEIQEMDKQRLQAIEALEISDGYVKCQKCGIAVPLLSTGQAKEQSNLCFKKQIKWIQNYSHDKILRPSYVNEVKQIKQELAELLEEESKADKLRSLPSYSSKMLAGNLYVYG
jgi:hypothetical protein